MTSLIETLRVSLRRARADWPMVAAAWLVTLIAAALVAAGPIYWSAASLAGLERTLADAAPADRSVTVQLYAPPSLVASVGDRVSADLDALPTAGGSVVRDIRGTSTLAIAPRPDVRAGDVAQLGFLDDLAEHAVLAAGTWPADGPTAAGQPVDVALAEPAARELGLSVGDELSLVTQVGDARTIRVRLVGIFAVADPADAYWHRDAQLTSGVVPGQGFRTLGPFLTSPGALLAIPLVSLNASWHAAPDVARLTVDDVSPLIGTLDALPGRLEADIGQAPTLTTGLPAMLAATQRSLLVSGTNLALLVVQLAVLAGYAVVLVALLLVDHRRTTTSLLLSRGSGPSRIALLALVEGLVVVVPAVVVGPWLALAAVHVLDVAGPLASIGLAIAPHVTAQSYAAAVVIGAVCIALLALPAVLSTRAFAAEQRGLSRQETRPFAQRVGLDVAILAVAGIGLWQLRLYGAPLSRTVRGDIGLDPLLVAAPAISILAGGVLALRVIPMAAPAVERAVSRRRGLVGSLGSRELARRPTRYTRSVLLLMIAISIGVFAVTYGSTWSESQRDQAAYQAGADVRVVPASGGSGLPAFALPAAYAGVDGVRRATPVERLESGVSLAGGSADLLAVDAGTAAEVTHLRPDLAAAPLADLMATLRAGRPDAGLVSLPVGTAYLRITPRLRLVTINQFDIGPINAGSQPKPLDPALLPQITASVSATIRDARGLLYSADSSSVPIAGTSPSIILGLAPVARPATGAAPAGSGGATAALGFAGPIELAGLGVDLWLPDFTVLNDGYLGVDAVAAAPSPDGPWTDVPLSPDTWQARIAQGSGVPTGLSGAAVVGTTAHIADAKARRIVLGNGTRIQAAGLAFVPAAVQTGQTVPAIVNRAFLAATAAAPGDTIPATLDGADAKLAVAGVVETFPTTDPDTPLAIVDEPTLGLLRLVGTGQTRSPSEWWLQAAPGRSAAVAAALRQRPFEGTDVVTAADLAVSLSTDPVAIGTIGALALGFVATAVLAVLGLVVSIAVSARERRTEFALLRALGLSGRQLAGWLWLESGSLVLVSLVAGTGLGLLVGWLVLPFVTVTQAALAPVPPVIIDVPWDRVLELDLASALALAVTLLAVARLMGRLGLGSVLRMGED